MDLPYCWLGTEFCYRGPSRRIWNYSYIFQRMYLVHSFSYIKIDRRRFTQFRFDVPCLPHQINEEEITASCVGTIPVGRHALRTELFDFRARSESLSSVSVDIFRGKCTVVHV